MPPPPKTNHGTFEDESFSNKVIFKFHGSLTEPWFRCQPKYDVPSFVTIQTRDTSQLKQTIMAGQPTPPNAPRNKGLIRPGWVFFANFQRVALLVSGSVREWKETWSCNPYKFYEWPFVYG